MLKINTNAQAFKYKPTLIASFTATQSLSLLIGAACCAVPLITLWGTPLCKPLAIVCGIIPLLIGMPEICGKTLPQFVKIIIEDRVKNPTFRTYGTDFVSRIPKTVPTHSKKYKPL